MTEHYLLFSATLLGIESKRKIEIEHIRKLEKNKQLLIFDSSIVIELTEKSMCEEKSLTFNSFDDRDEVFDCISAIW